MKKKVEVSVVIPTYNRAYLITRAIKSVLNQTYYDFEILVVDDGSKDNTREIVESSADNRIKYIRHEQNRGVSAARNTAITIAQGKYVAFLDSDDEWLPEKLEKQVKAFEVAPPQVGIVYVGMLIMEGKSKKYIPPNYVTRREGYLYYDILVESIIVRPSTAMIKRDCFEKVGIFDEKFLAGEDWDLWIRIAKYYHFKYIDKLLVHYKVMPDRITNSNPDFTGSRIRELILAKHSEDIKRDRRILSRYYVKTGDSFCLEKQLQRGRRYFLRAAMAYPFNVESPILAYIASALGQRAYDIAATSYQNFRGWWFSRMRKN